MYICNRCICSTLLWNKTYHTKGWIRNDDNVWLIEPRDKLYQSVEKLVLLLARAGKLLFIKDIITDETLKKRKKTLLEMAISDRHWNPYLWLLIQSYLTIPKQRRRQVKSIFVWYAKEKADFKMIRDLNSVLTHDELVIVRDFLKPPKHTFL